MSQPFNAAAPPAKQRAANPALGNFVINLSASTTPMALAKPTSPELARFTFFVSRRREEGRERFRLHMGYFPSRAEAEQMLEIVRDVYPAAWVGDAPGSRLRAGAGADATATPPARPAAASVAAPPAAAPVIAQAAAKPAAQPVVTKPEPAKPPAGQASTMKPAAPVVAAPAVAAPVVAASVVAASAQAAAAPPPPRAAAGAVPDLSDSQVLRVLEQRVVDAGGGNQTSDGAAAAREIALLTPQDTQTWRDIKAELKRDAAVQFAVQLEWSVSEIDIGRVPSLAIFGAYTLYRIEGNRQGRKWFGLRLGFFRDALSAKQVAYYVRSEFASVAVVPVSVREREQARDFGAIDLPRGGRTQAGSAGANQNEEITLIDDTPAVAAAPAPLPRPANAVSQAPTAASAAARTAGARRTGRPRGGEPKSLEETLEILGASQLAIDNGRGERLVLDDRAPRPGQRTTKFSRLLDRLSERLRK